MTDESKNDPRSRMRSLLDGGNDKNASETPSSPLSRLPRKTEAASILSEGSAAAPVEEQPVKPKTAPRARPTSDAVSPEISSDGPKRRQFKFGPAFWTITGTLSLIVNIILIVILLSLLLNVRNLQLGSVMNMPPKLLGGLYTNFEKMDRAHIKTEITVNDTVPVKFDLPVNQQTTVVLSQDVRIDGARVTITDGGPVSIVNAHTSIILPAGTQLPIILSIIAPVDYQLPVTLKVPVDIALQNTDLHEPFAGLQDVVRPLYCMVQPRAVNLDQQAVCVRQP